MINGRTINDREKLMGLSAASFVTVFFLTSVGSVLFYALSVSLGIIALHGAYREPDNLFLDEHENQAALGTGGGANNLFGGMFGTGTSVPVSSVSNV